MRFTILSVCILSIILMACTPTGLTSTVTTTGAHSQVPPTPPPALPSATSPATSTIDLPTSTTLLTKTQEEISIPTPTLNAWEMVQVEVARLRNLLERDSDGYNGLTSALEQDEPNLDWCAGLSTAIGDFNYVGDSESAQSLEELQSSQGCS